MNKTNLLLQMMEQPQLYTAEEWQAILADEECHELYTLMSITKSAVNAAQAEEKVTDELIDAEWQKIKHDIPSQRFSIIHKVAAMIVGAILLSGIAYAAILLFSKNKSYKENGTIVVTHSAVIMNELTPQKDTVATPLPKLYDNVPLGEIFEDLSIYYKVKVEYQNEEAPSLRLFYHWKPEYTLEKVVEMLNNFDWIQIQAKNDTIFIKTMTAPAQ